MKKTLLLLTLSLVLAARAGATPITYTATLSGLNENPATPSAGTGFATVVFDLAAHSLFVDVTFSGLTGTTTASHIHCCAVPPNNAGVATITPTFTGFPLGVTSGTYSHTYDTSLASAWNPSFVTANGSIAGAEAALAAGLADGQAYLNIHTNAFPGGEIRGVLATPEPATLSLLGLGLGAALRRRRAR
ncbi:MAG TPA: CHRD domain-containing protein [Vicinamibacterales bacterium]|nr:CHRD domain-containing protein [Vicinamibacterales bacterium]